MKPRPIIKNLECINNHHVSVVPNNVSASAPIESLSERISNVSSSEILTELDNIEQNEFNALLNENSLESVILEIKFNANEHIDKHVSHNICGTNDTSSTDNFEDLTLENAVYEICQKGLHKFM